MRRSNTMATKTMTLLALLTALVAVLQGLAVYLKVVFGIFAPSLVLIPIVIGTATCGKKAGAWLGFVFGLSVLISGDAAPFLGVNGIGTVLTVLIKGIGCGFVSGLVYEIVSPKNETLAVILAAIICPLVNTGIFLGGCFIFFMDLIREWAGGSNIGQYMIVSLVGLNFVFELFLNIVLSPVIVRLLNIKKKM